MIALPSFFLTFKTGDEITLVFSGGFIKGKIKETDAVKSFITLSDVYISGTQIGMEITLYPNKIDVIAQGKK